MHSHPTHLTQPQVALVSDLRDRKTRAIETTRDYTTRTPTSFAQDQIPERIASPSRHRLENHISREVFPTRRRIERNPRTQRARIALRVAPILRKRNTEGKKQRER
jgi:hypothetical protein